MIKPHIYMEVKSTIFPTLYFSDKVSRESCLLPPLTFMETGKCHENGAAETLGDLG
jgi:hypothetical protein